MADETRPPVIGEKRIYERSFSDEKYELTVVQKGPPDTSGYEACVCNYSTPCGRHFDQKEWALVPHPSMICPVCREPSLEGPKLKCFSPSCFTMRIKRLHTAMKALLLGYGHGYTDRRCPEYSALCEACLAYDEYIATRGEPF